MLRDRARAMIAVDALLMPARLATAPLRFGLEVGQEALDAGRDARRAITNAAEEALLAALDAVVARLVEEPVIDLVLARVEAAAVTQHVVDRMLADGVLEQVADRLLVGPELERVLVAAFASALPEKLITQLLASEAVWVLVDEVARSTSVTEAIAHQGTGFAEQVAAKARDRSRTADSELQRLAQLLLRPRRRDAVARPDPSSLPSPPQGAGGEPS
jgi:hypothetical protein